VTPPILLPEARQAVATPDNAFEKGMGMMKWLTKQEANTHHPN